MHPTELDDVFAGLNCFPTTPFDEDGRVAPDVLAAHLETQITVGPAAVFTGCGTGEFWSLDWEERVEVARTAVGVAAGDRPVLAGWAGASRTDFDALDRLAQVGVAGLLLMPPAPWATSADGIRDLHLAVADRTTLPRILYVKDPADRAPSWWCRLAEESGAAGIKDGTGDLDFVTGLLAEGWPSARLLNGTPTAEWLAPAYAALGVHGWSSAILNFAPTLARRFRVAVVEHDTASLVGLRDRVLAPLRRLRAYDPAFAVSLVKAAVGMRGLPVGRTRAPLTWPSAQVLAELRGLLDTIDDVVAHDAHGGVLT